MKYKYLIFSLAIFITGRITAKTNEDKKPNQPNIIFIIADDLGFGDLGYQFQNQRAKKNLRSEPWTRTPNLDRLAEQGVQLPNHYCAAPVCAPSRASLILGQHQGHANVRDNQFDKAIDNNHTIATVLKSAGYTTAAFGKWGLQGQGKGGDKWPAHPLNRGFDYYLGYMRHGDGHEHYPKEGIYRGAKEVYENHGNIADKLDKCYTADLWTAATKKWIIEQKQDQKSEKPFFIFLAFDTPHAVLELPTQAYPQGGGINGGLQWLGKPGKMINTASGVVDSWIHPDYINAKYDNDKNPDTPEVAWPDVYKRYATSTRRIDDAVGDIVQLIKDLKIDDNTVIIFTSDNGPSRESYLAEDFNPDFFNGFGPFDGIKRDALEGGIRVSALAYWPGHFPKGRIIKSPSSSYDWLPTFAQLAGVSAPAVADGVSLVPSLTNCGKQQESFVYVEYFNNGKTPDYEEFIPVHRNRVRNQMQMLILDKYVGLRYNIKSQNENFELYDVSEDPQQANNLAGNPEMKKIQQQMKDKVLRSRRPNDSAERPYDEELIPAVLNIQTTEGVDWAAFKGHFMWIPNVSQLTSSSKGIITNPDTKIINNNENQIIYFYGFIQIPGDGEYTFSLNSNKGAFLRIHDAAVIDEDFGYMPGTERQGKIKLKAGLHPFSLYYANQVGEKPLLDFQWSGPGIEKQKIPASVFMRVAKNKISL